MKKIIALAASVVLAGSMFAFAGCKDDEDSTIDTTIPGDYQEVSKEDASAALEKLDPEKMLPDISTDATAKLGFELGSDMTINANIPVTASMSGQSAQGKITMSASEEVKYNLVVSDKGESYTGAGYANANLSANTSMMGESQDMNASAKIKLYNDTQKIYASLDELKTPGEKGGSQDSELAGTKYKFDINELIELIMSTPAEPDDPSLDPNPAALYAESEDSATENIGFAEYIGMLEDLKVKVSLDQKSGLKVKLSATKESYDAILAYLESNMSEDPKVAETIATVKDSVTVNKFNVDIYLSFAESGLFEKAAIDMDIDVKVKGTLLTQFIGSDEATAGMKLEYGDSTFAVKGGLYLGTYDGTVTLPDGIATDVTYVEVPLSGTKQPDSPDIAA